MFLLQIVYPDGSMIRGPAGQSNAFERDLIAICKAAILDKGVGLLRTEAQVAAAIEAGMAEAIMSLKRDVRLKGAVSVLGGVGISQTGGGASGAVVIND